MSVEDDNVLDILKWLFKDETNVDLAGVLTLHANTESTKWNVRLKGNLLGMRPVDAVTEPMLIVCENIKIVKSPNNPCSFIIHYAELDMQLEAENEQDLFNWMIKLSICSHSKKQAELDQLLHEYNVEAVSLSSPTDEKAPGSPLRHFFLAAPFKKEHTFSVFHSYNMPNRKIVCEEEMYESKLCMVLPIELSRTFRRFAISLRDVFKEKFCNMRNSVLMESYMHLMRHLNSNIEVYTQMIEFLDDYVGPSFKPSKEKFRLAFSAMPINLHVQCLKIRPDTTWSCVTCGAVTAASLRFRNGGLSRIRDTLNASLDQSGKDHTLETRFYTRRKTLENASTMIEALSRKINNEWKVGQFGTVDKVGLHLLGEVKQLHQLLLDLIQSFPNVHNLVDSLCLGGLAQMSKGLVGETLSNQLDSLDAAFISLNTKMAVIDKVNDDQTGRGSFEENAKASLNAVLDMLLDLINSLYYAQFMGLIVSLRKPSDAQNYFQLQLRYDIVLAQAITLVSTCLLNNIEHSTKQELEAWERYGPFISFFGLLSCYGDERGMIEDMREIWSIFYGRVRFCFTALNSTISKNCIPSIGGQPTAIEVAIPLTAEALEKLPKAYANGDWFRVKTVYWNIGVNHEATLAATMGDVSLEESVNRAALSVMSNILFTPDENQSDNLINLFNELKKVVEECPTRKNISIMTKVQSITRALNGTFIVSCKSGKDRTSMACTLEQGFFLKQNFGISQTQMDEIVDCLRRDGVRRENCRKNVGKPLYSFSPFQINFLPKEFRPPSGTYSQKVSS